MPLLGRSDDDDVLFYVASEFVIVLLTFLSRMCEDSDNEK